MQYVQRLTYLPLFLFLVYCVQLDVVGDPFLISIAAKAGLVLDASSQH